MIVILGQNKDEIMQCTNIYQDGNEVVADFNNGNGYVSTLGTYATEERAKEVVNKIWEQIIWGTRTSVFSDVETYTTPPYFEMPKK